MFNKETSVFDPMVRVLDFRLSSPSLSPGQDLYAAFVCSIFHFETTILVPRFRAPFGRQEDSRPLAGPHFLCMRRVFHSQPMRFVRFDGKSVNHRLPVVNQPKGRSVFLVLTKKIAASEDENELVIVVSMA